MQLDKIPSDSLPVRQGSSSFYVCSLGILVVGFHLVVPG